MLSVCQVVMQRCDVSYVYLIKGRLVALSLHQYSLTSFGFRNLANTSTLENFKAAKSRLSLCFIAIVNRLDCVGEGSFKWNS